MSLSWTRLLRAVRPSSCVLDPATTATLRAFVLEGVVVVDWVSTWPCSDPSQRRSEAQSSPVDNTKDLMIDQKRREVTLHHTPNDLLRTCGSGLGEGIYPSWYCGGMNAEGQGLSYSMVTYMVQHPGSGSLPIISQWRWREEMPPERTSESRRMVFPKTPKPSSRSHPSPPFSNPPIIRPMEEEAWHGGPPVLCTHVRLSTLSPFMVRDGGGNPRQPGQP
ncbi:hypothetical protein LZ32DRAFT_651982 [Colletotrichum eremochloae]|nr:hypothetical protein LZ32DRAFT_651982 [Colletotrichum eremochloae]